MQLMQFNKVETLPTKRITTLEGQLARKNEVLAEVTEAYVRVKKNSGVL
jgi:hypothetical protein